MYNSHSFVVGDVHVLLNSANVNGVTSANVEVFSTLFCDRASMSSWTMEAIIFKTSLHAFHVQCLRTGIHAPLHCIVILPRDNPVCFSIETDHGVFDFSGLHQIRNCSQEIMSNVKATHAQDELACFFVFFFCRPSTS